MTDRFHYRRGDTGPVVRLGWTTRTGTPRDLTGDTCVAVLEGSDGVEHPVAGVLTGGDGFVDVAWDAADLDLTPDVYRLKVTATDGGRDYSWSPGDWPLVIVDD